jgi:acylphosphatase
MARSFAIGGYVRNLPGGDVEVVAEGEPAELDRFLTELLQELGGYVRDWDQTEQVLSEPLVDFVIRY